MQVAGKELDLDKILEDATELSGHKVYIYGRNLESDSLQEIQRYMFTETWDSLVKAAGPKEGFLCNPSAAVAALIEKGIPKEDVSFRNTTFYVTLPHCKFRVRRTSDGGTKAGPMIMCKGQVSYEYLDIHLLPEAFAEVALAFDSLIDRIRDRASHEFGIIREIRLEEEKKEKARKIMNDSIRAILEAALKPLGISYSFEENDGKVHLLLTQTRKAEMDIPMEDLYDKLTDGKAILESLSPAEAIELDEIGLRLKSI